MSTDEAARKEEERLFKALNRQSVGTGNPNRRSWVPPAAKVEQPVKVVSSAAPKQTATPSSAGGWRERRDREEQMRREQEERERIAKQKKLHEELGPRASGTFQPISTSTQGTSQDFKPASRVTSSTNLTENNAAVAEQMDSLLAALEQPSTQKPVERVEHDKTEKPAADGLDSILKSLPAEQPTQQSTRSDDRSAVSGALNELDNLIAQVGNPSSTSNASTSANRSSVLTSSASNNTFNNKEDVDELAKKEAQRLSKYMSGSMGNKSGSRASFSMSTKQEPAAPAPQQPPKSAYRHSYVPETKPAMNFGAPITKQEPKPVVNKLASSREEPVAPIRKEEPAPAPKREEPAPVHQEPAPVPRREEPPKQEEYKFQEPAPVHQEPAPVPRHEEPPKREEPAPTPRQEFVPVQHHVPVPTYEEPAPTPKYEEPAPVHQEPAPVPRYEEPAPTPKREEPAPVHQEPAPVPRHEEPPKREEPRRPDNHRVEETAASHASYSASGSNDICARCSAPIEGERLVAMNKKWHKHHFTCVECHKELSDTFFTNRDQAYCEYCYKNILLVCNKCKKPITGAHIDANGKLFHLECVGGENCAKCNLAIQTGQLSIQAADRIWHTDCFNCAKCKKILKDVFVRKGTEIWCKDCYSRELVCDKCKNPLGGQYISTKTKKFHNECFTCSVCNNLLGTDYFDVDGQFQCEACYTNTIGVCETCHQQLTGQYVKCLEKMYHENCFVCKGCNGPLGEEFYNVGGHPHCFNCASK